MSRRHDRVPELLIIAAAVCRVHRTRGEKQDEHRSQAAEGAVVLISVDIPHDKKEEHMM